MVILQYKTKHIGYNRVEVKSHLSYMVSFNKLASLIRVAVSLVIKSLCMFNFILFCLTFSNLGKIFFFFFIYPL